MAPKSRRSSLPRQPASAVATEIAVPAPELDRGAERAVFGLLLAWVFVLCVFPLGDTDFWWHLKTGELIWSRGQVPQTDWYLFTDYDKPWIDLHWGFQVLIAGLYALGGPDAIVLTKALCLTAAVAIAWRAAGNRLPAALKAAFWLLPIISVSGRGYARPEILTQLFLAIWLWIVSRVESRPRLMWWLPVLQLVWINCHALFILGLVVGGCYLVDYLLRSWMGGRFGLAEAPAAPQVRPLLWCIVAGVLVSFLNPYFEEGAIFPLVLYRKFSVEQAFYAVRIGEFQRPFEFVRQHGLTNLYAIAQLAIFILGAVSFLYLLIWRRRWSPYRLLIFAGFANLAWEATRNANIFALVGGVVLCANVQEGWMALSPSRRTQRFGAAVMTAILGLGILLVVTGVWGRTVGEGRVFGLGERPNWYAHAAAKFAGNPEFPPRAFVAHMGQASVYTYHNGPDRKVFMDPRLEVNSQNTFRRFEDILARMSVGDRGWEVGLRDEKGRLPVVILDSRYSRAAINGLLNTPSWRMVFADPAAAVFIETTLADRLGLPLADPTPLMNPDGIPGSPQ